MNIQILTVLLCNHITQAFLQETLAKEMSGNLCWNFKGSNNKSLQLNMCSERLLSNLVYTMKNS